MDSSSGKSSPSGEEQEVTLERDVVALSKRASAEHQRFQRRQVYLSVSWGSFTFQGKRGVAEAAAPRGFLLQIAHLNGCQRIHALNLAQRVVRERETPDDQFSYRRTILQEEVMVWILSDAVRSFGEAVLSNVHRNQVLQPDHLHFAHMVEAVVANH